MYIYSVYIPQGPIGTQIYAQLGFDTLFGGASTFLAFGPF